MVFTVFISHGKGDVEIVKALYSTLKQSGINVYVAEFYPEPGLALSDKIVTYIESSDCFLVFLTQESIKSAWVQQEIGIAREAKRLIIPVVEKGVKVAGVLEGIEYIELDRKNLWNTIKAINEYTTYLKARKEQAESARAAGIAILAILVGLLFIGALAGEK